ncbi:MAG TPA: hypothetical protein VGQ76_10645 [Thermoanaerobaculia bacterium]|jgi:hypothetical protein|nr:hypothetical protein [Thermoanaerobaculia bacterium]
MATRRLLFLAVLVLTLPFLVPESALANPHDSLMTYYTGSCPYGLEYNGYKFRECNNTITQDGTLDGTWKCDDQYDCIDGDFNYFWYEKCNGVWVFRYVSEDVNRWPEEEECHCS